MSHEGRRNVWVTPHAQQQWAGRCRFNGLRLRPITWRDVVEGVRAVTRWRFDTERLVWRGLGREGEVYVLDWNRRTVITVLPKVA